MISLLKFNREYYEPIKTGRKTQTIRKSNKRLKAGDKVKAIFTGTDKELLIKITDTGYKQFKYINDDDAEREGYDTVEELKSELLNIYPMFDALTRVYWIRFEVI